MTKVDDHLDLKELDYVGWVSSEAQGHVIINFYTGTRDPEAIHNTYVYLLSGRLAEADLSCEPYFPPVVNIEQASSPDGQGAFRNSLRINFKKGFITFFYEHASLQRKTTYPKRVQRSEM